MEPGLLKVESKMVIIEATPLRLEYKSTRSYKSYDTCFFLFLKYFDL